MDRIKILLADDHALVRTGIITVLKGIREFVFLDQAENGVQAIESVKRQQPDVLVLDISLPDMSGIDVTKTVVEKFPKVRVLILTMHENEEYAIQALKAGALGYILKNADREELTTAIKTVARGEKFISKRVADLMMDRMLQKSDRERLESTDNELPLTKREREILKMVAQGLSNQEIADKMFISPRTVGTHRTNIMAKLDIHDVVNLVRYAIDKGLTKE
jgi:two-component system response regulator NreC